MNNEQLGLNIKNNQNINLNIKNKAILDEQNFCNKENIKFKRKFHIFWMKNTFSLQISF